MSKSNKVSSVYLNLLITHIIRHTPDHEKILAELGLSQYLLNKIPHDAPVDLTYCIDMMHTVQERFADPLFCARAGTFIRPPDYGIIGILIMSMNTFEEAIDISYRYQHLLNDSLNRQPLSQGNMLISRVNDAGFNADYIRPYIEMELSSLLRMCHFITGDIYANDLATLEFRHAPASSLESYMNIFSAPVKFKQDNNQVMFHKVMLEAPLHGKNPDLVKLITGQVKSIDSSRGDDETFIRSIETYIRYNMVNGSPSLEKCARSLGISESTIKRRLRNSDTQYKDLVDHIRFSSAKNLLANPDLSLAEISLILGFSHVSTFSRSFRRWSDMSPLYYRKQLCN